MTRMLTVVLALVLSSASAYHDPDLNYHLNKLRDCDTPGYHYPAPPVQLSTAGVKYAAPLPAYNAYLPPVPPPNNYLPPQNNYLPPPAPYVPPVAPQTGYLPPFAQTSYSPPNNFFSHPARQPPKHVTGWHTGAEQYNFPPARTAVPHALYNQAPILGKITAAPLFTKYSAPQNQLGYFGKTLNTFGTETGGAVVTQAYGHPTGVYATSHGILPTTPAPIVQLWPSPTPPAQAALAPLPQALPAAPLPAVTYHGAPLQQLPAVPVVPRPFAHAKNVHTDFVENYDANPQYSYEYGVHDSRTGDIKHQAETRNGEVVRGQYSLVEPDGSVRTVDYVADWDTGFHANVRNSKDPQH